jgi:hypothetical protein
MSATYDSDCGGTHDGRHDIGEDERFSEDCRIILTTRHVDGMGIACGVTAAADPTKTPNDNHPP